MHREFCYWLFQVFLKSIWGSVFPSFETTRVRVIIFENFNLHLVLTCLRLKCFSTTQIYWFWFNFNVSFFSQSGVPKASCSTSDYQNILIIKIAKLGDTGAAVTCCSKDGCNWNASTAQVTHFEWQSCNLGQFHKHHSLFAKDLK
jgi:hypothetical protein